MSIDRLIPTSGAGVTGTDFAGAIQEEITGLWGNSVIPLTDVAGTGDAITAQVSPALTDGLAAGMNFWLVAAADNTGPATIAIGSEDPVDLVDDDGAAMTAGLLKTERRYLLGFDGTAMRVFGTTGQKRVADYQVFTGDGTWNKPAGTPDDALVEVELWAGGGGGSSTSNGGGGGGGEYKRVIFRAGDLLSSVSVTVATAAAVGVAGNNSSFGDYVTVYGGGGSTGSSSGGGGGGGPFAKGGNGSGSGAAGAAGVSAGHGGGTWDGTGQAAGDGYFGGGGGGGSGPTYNAGKSVFGGAGGAGYNNTGGLSLFGGNGGASDADGSAPGGGGGKNGKGARGEVRVRTIG
jgi:hypothetical protein